MLRLLILIGGNMSFNATFYTFSKKLNSTKQPSGGSDYSIELKADSSIINPTIKLDVGQSGNPTAYNYCYIAAFNRYYWVSNWRWAERLWTAECKVDSMASWKSNIGSYTAYVIRSASAYNGNVIDLLYPTLSDVTITGSGASASPNWATSADDGYYIIGIMGKDNGQNGGAVTYYRASPSGMTALCNYMLDAANFSSVTDITEDLLKCIFNPLQYIVSCMWVPFTPIVVNGHPYVGWWECNVAGVNPLGSTLKWELSVNYNIPKHPKAATKGNYLNGAPFSQYTLYAGAWGVIPINSAYLMGQSTLYTHLKVDLMTGSGKLAIMDSSGNILEEHFAQVGVPIQVGQNLINQGAVGGVAGGAANTISSALTGNLGGMLSSGLNTIGSAAELSQSIPSTVGGNGSMTYDNQWKLIGKFMDIANEDNTSRGRPLCAARTISGLSGYIECADADPDIPCTDRELSEIITYMNTGFYYE